MGGRVSIQFKNGDEHSVVLFNHWGGMEFVVVAEAYVKDLKADNKVTESCPLGRLEPEIVMVDFIREITKKAPRVESSLYLGATSSDGDNSDNGHHIIDLKEV